MVKAIAIDGPSASGKSTVSKGVAAELGFIYVDSGALYRGVTWQAIRKGVDAKDSAEVIDCMLNAEWDFFVQDGAAVFSIDGDVRCRSFVARMCVNRWPMSPRFPKSASLWSRACSRSKTLVRW